jgi:hypothetical protein
LDIDELLAEIQKLCKPIGWKASRKLLPDKRQFKNLTQKAIYNLIVEFNKKRKKK